MSTTPTLTTGLYWLSVPCPRCDEHELVSVALHAQLSVPDDDLPSLKVRAKSKPVDHACGQTSLRVDVVTGVVVGDGDPS